MVFSYTAPFIDKEKEKEEFDALSDEEKRDLRSRIYGGSVLKETRDEMERAPALLQEALEMIPNQDKAAYLEAVERSPELVERESNALVFMRAEKYDAWAAARRLVEHWKMRLLLFGEARAFLPMTIAGAMANDLETLQRGIIERLPNDEHGRPVMFADRIRCCPSVASRDVVLRIFFYVLHVICQDDAAQKKGCVLVVNIKGLDIYRHHDRILSKLVTKIMNKCMPTPICAIHMCSGPGQSVANVVLPVVKHIAGKYLRMHTMLHSGHDAAILRALNNFGLKRENLSHVIGGDISRDDYATWLAERQLVEERQFRNN